MKYSSICLIINILAISVIFSSADDSSDSDTKSVIAVALINITDKKELFEGQAYFKDVQGNNIDKVENGSSVMFNIEFNYNEEYNESEIIECKIYEKNNIENSKQLYDVCKKNESIIVWDWNNEEKLHTSQLTITKLPGSRSDEFEISCSAIICKGKCPEQCAFDKKRKRRGLFKKLPLAIFLQARKSG